MSFLSTILGSYGDDLSKAAGKGVANNLDDIAKTASKVAKSSEDDILERTIGGLVKSQPSESAYTEARKKALDFLQGTTSDDIVSKSKQYLKPGQEIYRANNSPLGISWTTSYANALKEANSPEDIISYVLQENDRYISPNFVDKFSDSIYPQEEVIFNGRGLVDNTGRIIPNRLRKVVSELTSDNFTKDGNLRSDILSKLLERSQNG